MSECLGLPVWQAKELVPSSEFTQWKEWFALKWKISDRQSYEFGLLRMVIANTMGGRLKLENTLLQRMLTEPPKDWWELTEDEQAERIRLSKAAHGFTE